MTKIPKEIGWELEVMDFNKNGKPEDLENFLTLLKFFRDNQSKESSEFSEILKRTRVEAEMLEKLFEFSISILRLATDNSVDTNQYRGLIGMMATYVAYTLGTYHLSSVCRDKRDVETNEM